MTKTERLNLLGGKEDRLIGSGAKNTTERSGAVHRSDADASRAESKSVHGDDSRDKLDIQTKMKPAREVLTPKFEPILTLFALFEKLGEPTAQKGLNFQDGWEKGSLKR